MYICTLNEPVNFGNYKNIPISRRRVNEKKSFNFRFIVLEQNYIVKTMLLAFSVFSKENNYKCTEQNKTGVEDMPTTFIDEKTYHKKQQN